MSEHFLLFVTFLLVTFLWLFRCPHLPRKKKQFVPFFRVFSFFFFVCFFFFVALVLAGHAKRVTTTTAAFICGGGGGALDVTSEAQFPLRQTEARQH